MAIRSLQSIQPASRVTDGDGVRINRNLVQSNPSDYDPFLLLDEIVSDDAQDYIGGFPEHPHRGFETVTYMLQGSMLHRDHLGNEGLLTSGSVQWMTAGRGVLHSEMPQQESGRMHGFQLWINLPGREKMSDPNYQEYSPDDIPEIELRSKSTVKVIAGVHDIEGSRLVGPVSGITTRPDYLDCNLVAGDSLSLPVDAGKRTLFYVYKGTVRTGHNGAEVASGHLGILGEGDTVHFETEQASRFLLLAGHPIEESVSRWGPFVMNTEQEIEKAIADYRNGTLV
jgi:quercetin 2,3-dioxygenase